MKAVHVHDAAGAPEKMERTKPRQGGEGQQSPGVLAIYASGACLVVALTLLLVELFIMLAVAGGPMLSSINEMNTMLRNLNQGASEIDFNFGITVNQPGSSASASTSPSGGGHGGEASPPTFDEASGDAFFAWCEAAPCLAGRNCTSLILGLRDGVDPTTGAPAIPFADTFCDSVKVMNDQLCFCEATLTADGNFPDDGQVILDNMGFVAMLCPGFGQENVAERGQCAGL